MVDTWTRGSVVSPRSFRGGSDGAARPHGRRILRGTPRATLVPFVCATILLSACGKRQDSPTSGTLTVAASGACLALVQAAADAFHDQYPQAHIRTVNAEGFRATETMLRGQADLVVLARGPLPEETRAAAQLKLTLRSAPIAIEGIALVAHPSQTLASVAEAQAGAIAEGRIRRWQDLGASRESLEVFAPEPSTGTGAYVAALSRDIARSPVYFVENDSAVVAQVAQRSRAFGFVGSGYLVRTAGLHPRVHVFDVRPRGDSTSTVSLSQASLADGSYPLTSEVTAITRGEPGGLAAGFLAFMTSQRGQRAVERVGLTPIASSSFDVHLR